MKSKETQNKSYFKQESQESNASTTSQPTMTCDHDCEE